MRRCKQPFSRNAGENWFFSAATGRNLKNSLRASGVAAAVWDSTFHISEYLDEQRRRLFLTRKLRLFCSGFIGTVAVFCPEETDSCYQTWLLIPLNILIGIWIREFHQRGEIITSRWLPIRRRQNIPLPPQSAEITPTNSFFVVFLGVW